MNGISDINNIDNELYLNSNDLVFTSDKENGVYSGGFSLKTALMKAGMSPIVTLNQNGGTNNDTPEKVSDLFDSLVLPNWALSYKLPNGMHGGSADYKSDSDIGSDEDNDVDEIDDDLHDKLLELAKDTEHQSQIAGAIKSASASASTKKRALKTRRHHKVKMGTDKKRTTRRSHHKAGAPAP